MPKHLGRMLALDLVTRATEPRLRIDPGETVIVDTEDAVGGRLRQPEDLTFEKLRVGYPNPLTGPIFVNGAEPGDVLAVDIQEIKVDTQGYTRYRAGVGVAGDWFESPRAVLTAVEGDVIIYSDKVRFPLRPMIGTIGVSPIENDVDVSEPPGKQGGNMDCKDVRAGARLFLPVQVPGALLSLGDVHASMGDGEITGTGVEIRASVTIQVALEKGHPTAMTWPRLDLPDAIATIVSMGPMEKAFEMACREMILWLEEEYGLARGDAYNILSNVGDGRVCQAVNTIPTLRCVVPKFSLPASAKYPARPV